MSDRFLLSLICLLPAFLAATPAAAQKAPEVPGPISSPAPQEDQEPQPEPPKKILNVIIKDDLLSVELSNVDFGSAIRAVAEKAGFKIEGTGEVFSRKLNTKFTDIEVERGVLRLLTLVKESNYMLHYDPKGMISRLEILGISSGKPPSVTTRQPMRPTPALRQPAVSTPSPDSPQVQRPSTVTPLPQARPIPPVMRRRVVPSRAMPSSQPAVQPSVPAKPPAAENDEEEEEPVEETPYVAPQPRLAPVPVRKP